MLNPYYGSTEYYERELLKARIERQAVQSFVTQELKAQAERYTEAENLAALAEVIERADSRVRIAEQELKKQKEKEEEAKKAQEPKASPEGEEEDA